MMKQLESKVCAFCGKTFQPNSVNQICCNKECAYERHKIVMRWNSKMYYKKHNAPKEKKLNPEPKKEKPLSLQEISALAREKGMSYGQYIARVEGGMRG